MDMIPPVAGSWREAEKVAVASFSNRGFFRIALY